MQQLTTEIFGNNTQAKARQIINSVENGAESGGMSSSQITEAIQGQPREILEAALLLLRHDLEVALIAEEKADRAYEKYVVRAPQTKRKYTLKLQPGDDIVPNRIRGTIEGFEGALALVLAETRAQCGCCCRPIERN